MRRTATAAAYGVTYGAMRYVKAMAGRRSPYVTRHAAFGTLHNAPYAARQFASRTSPYAVRFMPHAAPCAVRADDASPEGAL